VAPVGPTTLIEEEKKISFRATRLPHQPAEQCRGTRSARCRRRHIWTSWLDCLRPSGRHGRISSVPAGAVSFLPGVTVVVAPHDSSRGRCYDFANSAFAAIVLRDSTPPYYPANLVVGQRTGRGDFLWRGHLDRHGHRRLTSPDSGGRRRTRRYPQALLSSAHGSSCVAADRPHGDRSKPGMVLWAGARGGGASSRTRRRGLLQTRTPAHRAAEQLGRVYGPRGVSPSAYADRSSRSWPAYPFRGFVERVSGAAFPSPPPSSGPFGRLPSFIRASRRPKRSSHAIGSPPPGARESLLATLREILTAPERVHMRRFSART